MLHKIGRIVAATAILLLALSCVTTGSNSGANTVPEITSPSDDAASVYTLGAGSQIQVFVWDGDQKVKQISIYPTGEVIEKILDESMPRDLEKPALTAIAYQGRDYQNVALRSRYPLIYSSDYLIGPADVLNIEVWKNEDLTRQVQVRPDGKITLPLIDDVMAGGYTRTQLQEKLALLFKEFIAEPEISVSIVETNSYKVYVQGRVMQPGVYDITQTTTIVQAIAMAGGFTEWADTTDILIIRKTSTGSIRLNANYKKIVKKNEPESDVVLRPGDTIIVGP